MRATTLSQKTRATHSIILMDIVKSQLILLALEKHVAR